MNPLQRHILASLGPLAQARQVAELLWDTTEEERRAFLSTHITKRPIEGLTCARRMLAYLYTARNIHDESSLFRVVRRDQRMWDIAILTVSTWDQVLEFARGIADKCIDWQEVKRVHYANILSEDDVRHAIVRLVVTVFTEEPFKPHILAGMYEYERQSAQVDTAQTLPPSHRNNQQ